LSASMNALKSVLPLKARRTPAAPVDEASSAARASMISFMAFDARTVSTAVNILLSELTTSTILSCIVIS
jgi:hypothetical protein